ncbi:hypothetical protein KJK32_42690 [Streptomyces sp. JCM17656]|nr:hypothetical protein KJK32_42690 [Streptomyces sp. JCM17656]
MTSQSRAVLGIALTPVLALASAAPVAAGTTAAAAASTAAPMVEKRAPGLWGARTLHAPNPNPASASGGLNALVSAGNGTLVSLTGDGLSRSTRIRPAGSTGWLPSRPGRTPAGTTPSWCRSATARCAWPGVPSVPTTTTTTG